MRLGVELRLRHRTSEPSFLPQCGDRIEPAARKAGMRFAASATAASTSVAPANVTVSEAVTPKSLF